MKHSNVEIGSMTDESAVNAEQQDDTPVMRNALSVAEDSNKMLKSVNVTRLVNGYIIQIKLVGISTEYNFVSTFDENVAQAIHKAVAKVLGDKV
jgi:hypothetical protein